ncbi:MAG: hypothetical protein KR126chlam5_01102 [Candidatus Anoxychlamydiales bacterium]|nr:hypothetical protein [Candidatus Anoxychlamydiales bacterium]
MAIPFLAGAATASLLNEDKTPTIIHNTYVPLTEKQADLYMGTQEYQDNLISRTRRVFFYIDKNQMLQPKVLEHRTSGKRKWITIAQAHKLRKNEEERIKKPKDKVILMTKGIGGLPPEGTLFREFSLTDTFCYNFVCFPICFPCIFNDCYKRSKITVPILRGSNDCGSKSYLPATVKCDQLHFNLVDKV